MEARNKVDYRCDFSVVAARIPGGIHCLLEIDERLRPYRYSGESDEGHCLLRLWCGQPQT